MKQVEIRFSWVLISIIKVKMWDYCTAWLHMTLKLTSHSCGKIALFFKFEDGKYSGATSLAQKLLGNFTRELWTLLQNLN